MYVSAVVYVERYMVVVTGADVDAVESEEEREEVGLSAMAGAEEKTGAAIVGCGTLSLTRVRQGVCVQQWCMRSKGQVVGSALGQSVKMSERVTVGRLEQVARRHS